MNKHIVFVSVSLFALALNACTGVTVFNPTTVPAHQYHPPFASEGTSLKAPKPAQEKAPAKVQAKAATTPASTEPEFKVDCSAFELKLPSDQYLVYLGNGEKVKVRKSYNESLRSEDVVPVGSIAIVNLTSRTVPMYMLAPYHHCAGISFADGKMIPMSELESAKPGTLVLSNGFERTDVYEARRNALLEKAAAEQSAQISESEANRKQR